MKKVLYSILMLGCLCSARESHSLIPYPSVEGSTSQTFASAMSYVAPCIAKSKTTAEKTACTNASNSITTAFTTYITCGENSGGNRSKQVDCLNTYNSTLDSIVKKMS